MPTLREPNARQVRYGQPLPNIPGLMPIGAAAKQLNVKQEVLSDACRRGRMKFFRNPEGNFYTKMGWARNYLNSKRATIPGRGLKEKEYRQPVITIQKDYEPGDPLPDGPYDRPRRAEEVRAQADYERFVKQQLEDLPRRLTEEGIDFQITQHRQGHGLNILPQSFVRYPGYYGFSVR